MFYDNKLQFFYWEARSGFKVRATPPLPDFLFQKSLFLKKTKKLSAKRENQSDEMLRNPFARSDQTRRINSQRPLLRYVNRVARTLHVRRLATGSTDGEWDLLERLAFLCTTSLCVSTAFNVCVYVVKKKNNQTATSGSVWSSPRDFVYRGEAATDVWFWKLGEQATFENVCSSTANTATSKMKKTSVAWDGFP